MLWSSRIATIVNKETKKNITSQSTARNNSSGDTGIGDNKKVVTAATSIATIE